MTLNQISVAMESGTTKLKKVSINGADVAANDISIKKEKGQPALITVTFWADVNWLTTTEEGSSPPAAG